MYYVGFRYFIEKYLMNNENFILDLEGISTIKIFFPGDVLNTQRYTYFINFGRVDSIPYTKHKQTMNFYNKGKDKLFFDYSFCFISNYLTFKTNKKMKESFVVVEESELILFEYSELKVLIEKYDILEKFSQILQEFDRNKVKKIIYRALLQLEA